MSTYFRAVSRSFRGCPRLRCGEDGSSCPAGTSPVFSTDDAGCPICTCRQLTAFLRHRATCPPLDCSHVVCVGPVRFSSRLVGHCPVCECVPVDDEAKESVGTVTSSSCPELNCSEHIRCRGGRKLDVQTGCETCECVDDECADCAAVCDSSEPTRCAAVCQCDVINIHSCRPLPIDCELRDGCVLGTDADGCEVCQCAAAEMSTTTTPSSMSVCPQITCPLTCDGTGYAVDENGCRVCACARKEAETTTKMTAMTCAPVDCASQCPEEFDVVKGDDRCEACVCTKAETVVNGNDDVTEPSCDCALNDCSDCKSPAETDRQNHVTAAKCEPLTTDDCDVNCAVATDDAGCQFCLCDDRVPEQETETEMTDDSTSTDVKVTTIVANDGDDATSKNMDDACEHQFICHPICQTVRDSRGCVVECRCDDVISSLADMQQEDEVEVEVVAEPESRVMCPTANSVCSCDVDEEEWKVNVDGCLTCVCVTPSTTASDIRSTDRTTTIHPRTSSVTDTTTQTRTSTTTMTTTMTMTSTSQREVSSTASTVTTSSTVNVECRQLSDGDCTGVTCGDDGYAKDENGCDTCSCAVEVEEKQPVKTVYHVVAAARKGTIM